MRLDLATWPVDADALNHIGIDGTLGQPAGTLDLLSLRVEHIDKRRADGFALGFRVGDTLKFLQEQRSRMDADYVESHLLVGIQDIFELILTEQSVIHKDAGQILPDGFVEQHGGYGAVDTAREAEDDLIVAQLLFQACHRIVDKRVGSPVAMASTDTEREVGQDLGPLLSMEHLGMELDGIGLLPINLVGRILHVGCRSDDTGSGGQFGDSVAMAHPNDAVDIDIAEQRRLRVGDHEHGTAIFTGDGAIDFAAVMMRHELGTIADAKQRKLALDVAKVGKRSLRVTNRERAAT